MDGESKTKKQTPATKTSKTSGGKKRRNLPPPEVLPARGKKRQSIGIAKAIEILERDYDPVEADNNNNEKTQKETANEIVAALDTLVEHSSTSAPCEERDINMGTNEQLSAAQMTEILDNSNARLTNTLELKVAAQIATAMSGLTGAVKENAEKIEDLSNEVRIISDRTDPQKTRSLIEQVVEERLRVTPAEGLAQSEITGWVNDPREYAYLEARRAIRIWPVVGDTEDLLWQNTGSYLEDVLKVTEIGKSHERGM